MGIIEILNSTDWKLLAEQKMSLVHLEVNPCLNEQERDHITGLLYWIDSIQDYAVDELKFAVADVFPSVYNDDDEPNPRDI